MSRPQGTVPDYVPVEQARAMPGLRIAFTQGMPGPWSVAAKVIFDIKGLDYIAMPQEAGGENRALREWTGQTSAPVAMLNDERPRIPWSEILVLAEQLQPEPRLIPLDESDRITMFGLCHEMCGDEGLGWSARLLLFAAQGSENEYSSLHAKYSSRVDNDHARRRVSAILAELTGRLERQAVAGSRYFVGDRLSAADIYWAAFSNLFSTMPAEFCVMPDHYKALAATLEARLGAKLPQILLDHRDHVVRTYFRIPIAF